MLINRREKVGIKHLKSPKAFIDYSQTIDDVYVNSEDYNPMKNKKVLTVFNDMIADMESNRKLDPLVTEEEENSMFRLLLCHNLILKSLKL